MSLPPPPLEPAPDLVLHAAAWTDVDGAEEDPQGAAAVNVGGTQNAAALGAPLVAYSTDYVFDGTQADAVPRVGRAEPALGLRPDEAPRRGRGRRAGVDRPHLVALRADRATTSCARCSGSAPERDEVGVVDDQLGCPTYVGHLAAATRGS